MDIKNFCPEDVNPTTTSDFQQESESQQNRLTVPEPVFRPSSFSPSEDYVIVDESEQEKPVEKPDEQGLLLYWTKLHREILP